MIECKCCKNLFGFAASRPPCFVFTVCLAAFGIGLFSLGYFVQVYGWFDDVGDIQNKVAIYLKSVIFSFVFVGRNCLFYNIIVILHCIVLRKFDAFSKFSNLYSHLTSVYLTKYFLVENFSKTSLFLLCILFQKV